MCGGMRGKMKFLHIEIKRLVLVLAAVITMGFCLSFLEPCGFGTDPCTCMNLGISRKLGMLLGSWQALLNCILFGFVVAFDRSKIGWGTLANMILVGYSFDFFTWLNGKWLPEGIFEHMPARVIIAVLALFLFVFAVSTYIASDLGTSPYDAMPSIVAQRCKKLSFRTARIIWDCLVCMIGALAGNMPGVVTVAMAFVLGPVITWMKENVIGRLLYGRKGVSDAQL